MVYSNDTSVITDGSKFNIDADGNLSFKPSVSIPDKNKYTVIVEKKMKKGTSTRLYCCVSIQSEEDVIFYIEKPEAEAELEAEPEPEPERCYWYYR